MMAKHQKEVAGWKELILLVALPINAIPIPLFLFGKNALVSVGTPLINTQFSHFIISHIKR